MEVKYLGTTITAKEIVREYLVANGYDGLWDDECGCEADDLFPCESGHNCEPGYKKPCDCGDGCNFHIGPKEPK